MKCLTTKQPWWNFFHSKLFVFCRVANTLECCSNRVKKALAENAHWNGRRYFATQRKMGNHSFFILLLLFHVQCKTLKFIRIFLWIFSIIFQTCLLQAYIKTPSRIVYIYVYIYRHLFTLLYEIILLYLSTNQKHFEKLFYITKIPTNFENLFETA